ncbi:unnamed protein product, partial [Iphiclides podalirius]
MEKIEHSCSPKWARDYKGFSQVPDRLETSSYRVTREQTGRVNLTTPGTTAASGRLRLVNNIIPITGPSEGPFPAVLTFANSVSVVNNPDIRRGWSA